jgi:3-hydroxyisobutyrate dehydrogenase-like beta-hydroxyacid dehydrogenase
MSDGTEATGIAADEAAAAPPIALGIIGLGSMGGPMARCLTDKGFDPQVFDPNPQQLQVYAIEGNANPAATPTSMAQMCNVIVVAIPDEETLRNMVGGPNGIVHGAKAGVVVVDMSGTDPETGAALGRSLTPRGGLWIEAVPIGTPAQAKSGTLTVLAGGQRSPLDRVMPVLEAVSEKVIFTGPIGAASLAKSLAGVLSAVSLAAATEALIVAKRFGLDPAAAIQAIEAAVPPNCSPLSLPAGQILSPQPGRSYALTRAIADIERACLVARRNGVPVPMSAALRETCVAAKRHLAGSDELTGLVRWLEEVAGTELDSGPPSS